MTQQFEVGKTYATRSLGDYDCIFSFTIRARTAKSVILDANACHERGELVRRSIKVRDEVETFRPFGTYSMCATIYATERAMRLAGGEDIAA
jgi:hypothetical protein